MPHQHEFFATIEMGQLCMLMWAEVSDAFQDDDMLQALDLINEPLDDAARVSKAIFMPKYIVAILPGCYMGRQLYKHLAEFRLLLTEAQVERLEPLFQYGLGTITHIYIIQNYSEFKLDLNLTVPPDKRTTIHAYTISNSAVVSALLVDDLHS
jgi:hypothetical protein